MQGLVAVKRLLTARRCRVSGSSDAVTECKGVAVRCGNDFSSQADYSLWRGARWWVTLETPQTEYPGMAASNRKDESTGEIIAFALLACLVAGIVKWFIDDVWPTLWAWIKIGGLIGFLAAPMVCGALLRSPWGGGRSVLGSRLQWLSLLFLFSFFTPITVNSPWWPMTDRIMFGIGFPIGIFALAVVFERGMQWVLWRVLLPWLIVRRAKHDRTDSGAHAGSAGESARENVIDVRKLALETFGLKEPFTNDELKSRYRELARRTHPDNGGSALLFRSVQESYQILKR